MKKTSLVFIILLISMSSCVYSLFPIYTSDTVVFKKELLGKWSTGEKADEYIIFETRSNEEEEKKTTQERPPVVYLDSIKVGTLTMRFQEVLPKEEKDSIIARLEKKFADNDLEENLTPLIEDMSPGFSKPLEDLKKAKGDNKANFMGTIEVYEKKSYKMTVFSDGKKEEYLTHLVEIGDDLFLDIYPKVEVSSNFLMGNNYFPVHTFLKLEVTNDQLNLTFFDLEKLNKLFESNLIRIRHEMVEGSVLITAQPEEIQKFLDKYADDKTVFDYTESYSRI